MASGSRRQKRKRRQAARGGESHAPGAGGNGSGRTTGEQSPAGGGGFYARARAKDEAARAALEPLEEGERPTAVTVAAVVAFLLGSTNLVLYAAGVEVQGEKPQIGPVIFQSSLMLVAAWGMWRAKYWAVLGMEVILGFVIVIFAVLSVTASDIPSAAIAIAVVAAAGTLFWFLIRAMARIQMPERRPSS